MKRAIAMVLLLTMILPLFGCNAAAENPEFPVSFYYRREKLTYGSADSVIAAEEREAAGHTEDIPYLLGEYLKGPKSDAFLPTFPDQVFLVSFRHNGTRAEITLSAHFASLSGMDLTAACACLTMTVIALTGAETVTISAENEMLNNAPQITMDKNCLLLLDSSAAPANPQ